MFCKQLPTIFSLTVYVTCLQLMLKMAKPVLGPTGQVVDGGIDLNMEKGFAEYANLSLSLLSLCSNLICESLSQKLQGCNNLDIDSADIVDLQQ